MYLHDVFQNGANSGHLEPVRRHMCISTGGDLKGLTDNGLTTGLCGDRRNGWECACTAVVDVVELNRHDVRRSKCLTSDRME